MNRQLKIVLLTAALTIVGPAGSVPAAFATGGVCPGCALGDGGLCRCDLGYMFPVWRAQCYNWNGRYAHSAYGQPVALIVPPTANLQTNWGWGVSSSRVSRMDHQVQRNYPGPGPFGGLFRRTPAWPSDTTQFGVYNVRGPW